MNQESDMFAPGWPGIPARWTSSAKSGLGTAVSRDSRVWFTLSHGILNEIYVPEPLRRLKAGEIEDVLCIYKDALAAAVKRTVGASPRSRGGSVDTARPNRRGAGRFEGCD